MKPICKKGYCNDLFVLGFHRFHRVRSPGIVNMRAYDEVHRGYRGYSCLFPSKRGILSDHSPNKQVATPYFADDSTTYIMSYTLHIMCNTEGATIWYTLDGTDPAPGGEDGMDGSPTAYQVPAGESELVQQIGAFTIRAVATKEGMHVSDEISKTVTVTVC